MSEETTPPTEPAQLPSPSPSEQTLFNKLILEPKDQTDLIQKNLLQSIETRSGRQVIAYLANFKGGAEAFMNHDDKSALVMILDGLSSAKQLDFILHSQGGFPEAAEMIVKLLRKRFDHIRFIIPHSAKSAATMLALSGDEILMTESAELGPIDPQVSGAVSGPAQSIIDGFNEIRSQVAHEGKLNGAYVPLLNKMDVATIKRCETAIAYGRRMVRDWLAAYMLKGVKKGRTKAAIISRFFANHNKHLTHGKPIFRDDARLVGVNVKDIESVDGEMARLIWEFFVRYELVLNNNPVLAKIFISKKELVVKNKPTLTLQAPIRLPFPIPPIGAEPA